MKYRSPQNQRRAARGLGLIESHLDFGRITDERLDDLFIAATDSIADILHALNMAGVYTTTAALGPEDVLNRALWGYQGDFEDEPPADDGLCCVHEGESTSCFDCAKCGDGDALRAGEECAYCGL